MLLDFIYTDFTYVQLLKVMLNKQFFNNQVNKIVKNSVPVIKE